MPQIKASASNPSTAFVLDGLEYEKSDFDFFYDDKDFSPPESYDEAKLKVGIQYKSNGRTLQDPRHYSEYTDGTGTAYTSREALVAAVAALVSEGTTAITTLEWFNQFAPGDFTYTRSTTATRFDIDGELVNLAINEPGIDFDDPGVALLLEPGTTNLLLNSAAPATQDITTVASTYNVSFYGTGTITLSGTHTGVLNGVAGVKNVLTFTATAGTLTLTISGSVTNCNFERTLLDTSFIPTTGATSTKTDDNLNYFDLLSNNQMGSDFTIQVNLQKVGRFNNNVNNQFFKLRDAGLQNVISVYSDSTDSSFIVIVIGGVLSRYSISKLINGSLEKLIIKVDSGVLKVFQNGVETFTVSSINIGNVLDLLDFDLPTLQLDNFRWKMRLHQLTMQNVALSDAQCITLTT